MLTSFGDKEKHGEGRKQGTVKKGLVRVKQFGFEIVRDKVKVN